MNVNELKFLFSSSKEALVAVRPMGPTILFRQSHNDWVLSPFAYAQIIGNTIYDGEDFYNITYDEAKNIYKDNYPEEYFDRFENEINRHIFNYKNSLE
jgi:hypothetical protein